MEPFLGQIDLISFPFVPKGWAACDGRLLPIESNEALFALIGSRFGGDGRLTFALPNLTGKEPTKGTLYAIALSGNFPARP